jgi:hypothetical protein
MKGRQGFSTGQLKDDWGNAHAFLLRSPVPTPTIDVESLKRQRGGEVKMPELLARLVADCPRQQAFSIYDRCRPVYDRTSRY